MKTPAVPPMWGGAVLLLPWLVLALGLGATFVLWHAERRAAEAQVDAQVLTWTGKIASAIDYRLRSRIQVLRGVAALFDASADVTREEFRRYVEELGLAEDYPGMQGIGFSRFIPADRLAAHLDAVRAEGFPDYRIRPAGERPFYTAVLYLEPFSGENLNAFGYDMSPDPVRWAAASRARDSGEAALSGKVTLVQQITDDRQPGFLIFVPVFSGLTPVDVASRQLNLLGWAFAPVRMDALMHGVLDAVGLDGLGDAFEVAVYDGDRPTREGLLFASSHADTATPSASTIQASQQIELGGHRWSIRVVPSPRFLAEHIARTSTAVALVGTLSSLLLAFPVGVLVVSHRRVADALRLADEANTHLRERERDLLWAQRTAQLGSWSFDAVTRQAIWSEGMYRVWALDPSKGPPSYEAHREIVSPADWPRLDRAIRDALRRAKPYQLELTIRRPDGEERSIITIGTPEQNAAGDVTRLTGTVQDITDQKRAEAALYFTRAVVDRMSDSAYWARSDGRILYANAATCRMLGYRADELHCMSVIDIVPGATQTDWDAHWRELRGAGSLQFDGFHRTKAGDSVPVEIHADLILFHGIEYACRLARDISERRRIQEALRDQAVRDTLTGLFNRRYLDETLPREMHHSQRTGEPLAVAMLDLDHFKEFNDRFGHDAGDAGLRAIGGLLNAALRAEDIACRYGGEEITLILPGASAVDAAARLDELRLSVMGLRLFSRGRELPTVTVSAGVACVEPGETDPDRVLARADAALYRAKQQGRNRVVIAAEFESTAAGPRSEKHQDREIVADAARKHEDVPDAVRPGEAPVECVEDDAEGVEETTGDESPKTCRG